MLLPQRGMDGGGYYFFVSHITFYKLFITTFFACAWVLVVHRKHQLVSATVGAFCAAIINVGVLIVDVRLHSYAEFPEQYILENFGSPELIYAKGFGLIITGIVVLIYGFSPLVNKESPKVGYDRLVA
jgi:hypothetical protein